MRFKRNLHSADRVVRLVVGLGCVYVGFVDSGIIGNALVSTVVGIFGVVNLFAAAVAHCPVYGLAGVSTYHEKDAKAD